MPTITTRTIRNTSIPARKTEKQRCKAMIKLAAQNGSAQEYQHAVRAYSRGLWFSCSDWCMRSLRIKAGVSHPSTVAAAKLKII